MVAEVIAITDLTTGAVDGTGSFDKIMASITAQLKVDYDAGRITGTDYANVYLASIQGAMSMALEFALSSDKINVELEILEITKLKEQAEFDLLTQQKLNLVSQELQIDAQTSLIIQQLANAVIEATVLTAQELKIDADTALSTAQELKVDQETLGVTQDTANAVLQGTLIFAQELKVDAETTLVTAQELKVDQETLGVTQDTANAVIQGTVLTAQECLLSAQFDTQVQQTLKVTAEKDLLAQKKVTETAQTNAAGIGVGSVVGSQVALYDAQKDGFARDAEQKAARLFFDTWNSRRITDEATTVDLNGLTDANILRVANKLLTGVSA
jgi:hypothetical protein